MGTVDDAPAACRSVPAAVWRELCDSARMLQRLAPWKWMEPDRMFGLSLPGSVQIFFVSIMGGDSASNQAVFAFSGWEAFAHIRERLEARSLTIHDLIETPALQMSLVPEADIADADRSILACVGLDSPLPERVPVFRSHRTGFLPWLLNAAEARNLTAILRQTAGVAMRCETEPDMLTPPKPDLVRVLGPDADGHWQEVWQAVPRAAEFEHPVPPDSDKLAQVAALPPQPERVQFDLALSSATVGHAGERIRTTYLLAACDSRNGKCVGADVIMPVEGLAAMWRSVPGRFLDLCLHAGGRPREVEVASGQMMEALRPLLGRLPLKLTLRLRLPHFQAFLEKVNSTRRSEEPETR